MILRIATGRLPTLRDARSLLAIATGAAPTRAKPRHLEAVEQRLFVTRVRLDPRTRDLLFCAVPNGGKRGARTAALLKAEGVERGVPDLLFFKRSAGLRAGPHTPPWYIGLAIELKSPTGTGRVSPAQRRWHEGLRDNGWRVAIVTSAEDAWAILDFHLALPVPS